MFKNIIITILVASNLVVAAYAYIKSTEAEKHHTIAELQRDLAKELENKAAMLEKIAAEKAAEAVKQAQMAKEAMIEAEKIKKDCADRR